MKPDRLAERDGWICWICGDYVEAEAPLGSPWSATVDHVVPKSRGGSSEPENLRLAHRRCNGRRGSHLPELAWPAEFALLDAPPLWRSLRHVVPRSGREPGTKRKGRRHKEGRSDKAGPTDRVSTAPVVVALAPTAELASDAADWARSSAQRFLGGQWQSTVEATGVADCHVIRLSCRGPVLDPGRPR